MPTGTKRGAAKKDGTPVWVWAIPAVAALAFGGVRFMYFAFKTPSGSMMPSLLIGDHFFVRRSFTKPPRRGEVVVFRFPENPAQDFVKRIAAVPGDTLEAVSGRPVLNGWLVPHCYVGPYAHEGRSQELYVEYLGDATYGTLYDAKHDWSACKSDADCTSGDSCRGGVCGLVQGPFKVATNEVWVMGDNRNNSHDSRSWRGGLGSGLPLENIHGTARTIWMGAEPGRFGTVVEGPPLLPAAASALAPALEKCVRDRPPPTATTPPGR